MVKVIERDFNYELETPEEKKEKIHNALRNSLNDIEILNFEEAISVDQGDIEVYTHLGAIAVYPNEDHSLVINYSLAERVAAIYERETGEEAIIYKFEKRTRWAEGAVLEELRNKYGVKQNET